MKYPNLTLVILAFAVFPAIVSGQTTEAPARLQTQSANTFTAPMIATVPIGSQTRCEQCYGNCPGGYCPSCSEGDCAHNSQCGCPSCRHRPLRRWWLSDQDYFQSYSKPPCPGYSVRHFVEAQKANGRLAQMVFHGFHFQPTVDGALTMTTSGAAKVYDIARFWHETPGTLAVHPSGNPQWDQSRMAALQMAFARFGIELDAEQIVIAAPIEPGITGDMSIQIYGQRMLGSPLNPVSGSSSGSSTAGTAARTAGGTPNR